MESRETEIKNLVPSFVACLQPIIGRYRGVDGVNVLEHFEIRVEAERERYKRKFEAFRSDPACSADLIDSIEAEINRIADGELARARASGSVDFDTLTGALRDTHRSLDKAVGRIKGSN
jgi:hypothetical protein